jgi:hypothetical protein
MRPHPACGGVAHRHEATMKEVANAGKFLTLSDDLIKDVRTATDDCIH